MEIRFATIDDLDAITAMEAVCFPAAEAASRESFEKRLQEFPNHFWLLVDKERPVAMINGMVSNERMLSDEMFADSLYA